MLNFLSFYHAGKIDSVEMIFENERRIMLKYFPGQEIYKEFDYFIRFLHHRVLKVRFRWYNDAFSMLIQISVEKISIVFNVKVKILNGKCSW